MMMMALVASMMGSNAKGYLLFHPHCRYPDVHEQSALVPVLFVPVVAVCVDAVDAVDDAVPVVGIPNTFVVESNDRVRQQ